jgi:acetylornithine deacetylase/succinyl-diaminopimelate desuccinylase-like protein
LVDEHGVIQVPGVMSQVKPLSATEKEEFSKLPFNEKDFREQSGMIEGTTLLRDQSSQKMSPMVQLFKLPSLTVNAIQASSRKQAGNIINDSAWAKVTIRLVPDMNPEKCLSLLKDHLKKVAPWGVDVKFSGEAGSGAWSTDPSGPAFEAASTALQAGYGVAPFKSGCGGSIPFVKPFADALGGAPALLIGVEDPHTNAHGENESLLISDFEKACLSQAHLFAEIAERVHVKK